MNRRRNELLSLQDARQTSDNYRVATREGWKPGDKVIVPPPATGILIGGVSAMVKLLRDVNRLCVDEFGRLPGRYATSIGMMSYKAAIFWRSGLLNAPLSPALPI